MSRKLPLLAAATLAVAIPAVSLAQGRGEEVSAEHRAEISLAVKHDTSPTALRNAPEFRPTGPARGGRDFEPGKPEAVGNSSPVGIDPLVAATNRPVRANAIPIAATTNGTPIDPTRRVAPPDTTGDLGPNHYVQWVNLRLAIYDVVRSGGEITGFNLKAGFPKNGNSIWAGFGGACETMNDGDPIVQYDQFADRWVLTQFAVSSTPYTQCVAVSATGDPAGSYYRYAFSYGTDFNDFPKVGIWRDSYTITYNIFRRGAVFNGNRVCAFERAQMLVGGTARQICATTSKSYHSLLPADIEGATLPAAGTPQPLLSISSTALQSWRFNVNWSAGSGTLTGPTNVSGVAAFSRACSGGTCIPQPGVTQQLDSLADRLNYRLAYRNFGTYEALVVNHAVATGGVSGIRFYELRNASGQTIGSATPVVYQQGTYSPTADYRWMGSAAMDKTGGIAVGYNISSAATKPSIRYAYRGPGDTLGTLGGETSILAGPGVQTGNNLSRWGDYSMLSVDPVDGCTFVYTGEYIPSNGSFNWATYIGSFKLNSCN